MLILVDHRIDKTALSTLKQYGEVLLFPKSDKVYEAISSHPDIFVFTAKSQTIVAPNAPSTIREEFDKKGINYVVGSQTVGLKYPETVWYNAAFNNGLLICNEHYTSPEILNLEEIDKIVSTKQGYAGCNHQILNKSYVITSDLPSHKAISNSFYISPERIELAGLNHGFFGGCCGVFQNTLFVNGSLSCIEEEKALRAYILEAGFEVVELHNGPLQDIGGIFFFDF
jgi:hypothetical protein